MRHSLHRSGILIIASACLIGGAISTQAAASDSTPGARTLPCAAVDAADTAWVAFGCGRLQIHNYGSLGDASLDDFAWTCGSSPGDQPIYSGSFILAADSNESGVVFRASLYGYKLFVPNLVPFAGRCGFDKWVDVPLGEIRTQGCPGQPLPITGEIVVASYSDTLVDTSSSLPPAAGVTVTQTVVSSAAAPYGDFVLFRWELENRDDWPKGPWHAGTYCDWDIAGGANTGRYSDACNGYFVWDTQSPGTACGMLDPDQPSRYAGSDPTGNPAYRIAVWDLLSCCQWDYCPCITWVNSVGMAYFWWKTVREQPTRSADFMSDPSGALINPPFTLPPHGMAAIHQAMFFVDGTSNNPATIEANAMAVAQRAARWAGFARGDVNDDGIVDLADVCWLDAGLPIYPGSYCADVNVDGEVNAADIACLMAYVSGMGPAPQGNWRFVIPPVAP